MCFTVKEFLVNHETAIIFRSSYKNTTGLQENNVSICNSAHIFYFYRSNTNSTNLEAIVIKAPLVMDVSKALTIRTPQV